MSLKALALTLPLGRCRENRRLSYSVPVEEAVVGRFVLHFDGKKFARITAFLFRASERLAAPGGCAVLLVGPPPVDAVPLRSAGSRRDARAGRSEGWL